MTVKSNIIARSAVVPGPGTRDDDFQLTTPTYTVGNFETVEITVPAARILTLHQSAFDLIAAPGLGRAVSVFAVHISKPLGGFVGGRDVLIHYHTSPSVDIATIPVSVMRGGNAYRYADRAALTGLPDANPFPVNRGVRMSIGGTPGFTGTGADLTLEIKYAILAIP